MEWMQYGNVAFDIGNQINHVRADMVAASLAKLNRFTGHTKVPYSVARHSVYVSRLCGFQAGSIAAMFGLLHDVHESVLNDISTPVKRCLPEPCRAALDSLEDQIDRCIYDNLGVPYPVPKGYKDIVKRQDMAMLATERALFMPECSRDWELEYVPIPPEVLLVEPTTDWEEDRFQWMLEFQRLAERIDWVEGGFHDCG